MNWIKVLITGIVGGVVIWLYNFVMHGLIMGDSYDKYGIFRDDASPFFFVLAFVFIALAGALLFAKTRNSWSDGLKGGITFGFFVGLIIFFSQFTNVLIFKGFPYHLSWCWGGIELIGWLVFGAVAGLLIKK
ncbi:MAG: hypothetical protein MUP98_00580 [Candidatus Aminicenantes bacterium]|nr:hypothetical protein [Candidatus Aminicenantes bacterium]